MTAETDRLAEVFNQMVANGVINGHPVATNLDVLIDWPEFWATDHSSEDWLAWPLIPAKRQVALYAAAKTGKSIVTLAICAALATGRPILGNHASPPRSVLYGDWEMTAGDLQERLETLGYSAADDLSLLHYALLPALPPLNTKDGARELCDLAGAVDAEAVVIDTLGRAMEGEENSADSYREFARTTGLALKAAGRAVLRTDHAGKDRDRGQRGSSAKNDDVDVVFRLDLAEGGWTLTRTHSRVNWIPDKVIIARNESSDGTVTLTTSGQGRSYAPGTRELVTELRALGVTPDMSRRTVRNLLENAGQVTVRNNRLGDALAWMKAELPVFPAKGSGTTTTKPLVTGGDHSTTVPEGTATGTTDTNPQTPSVTIRDHYGDQWGPLAEVNGDQPPPHSGGQVPPPVPKSHLPEHDPESPFG